MQGQEDKEQKLLPIQDLLTVSVSDRIYYQAFLYFKICNWVGLIYNCLRTVAGAYMISIINSSCLTIFLILLLIVSFLQMAYYFLIILACGKAKLYYEVAEFTGHLAQIPTSSLPPNKLHSYYRTADIYDFADLESEDDEKKMRGISSQIKNFIHLSKSITDIFYKTQFGACQIIHAWALWLIIFYQFPSQTCQHFTSAIFLLGIYQYLQFYVLALFFIVVTPFYVIKQFYGYLLKRYKAFKLHRALRSQTYCENIKGDHQCKICLMPYEQNDTIIILKCNEMHNFHSSCLNRWTHSSLTCPLCRLNLTNN